MSALALKSSAMDVRRDRRASDDKACSVRDCQPRALHEPGYPKAWRAQEICRGRRWALLLTCPT